MDDAPPTPQWLARVREQDLILSWVGGHVSANASSLTSLDVFLKSPALTPAALADFRAFAGKQGVVVPSDADADAALGRTLAVAVARAKWGDQGTYGVLAHLDPEVRAAIAAFGRASAILQAAR